MTNQTNQIAEKQTRIADRETAPSFSLSTYKENEQKGYILTNEKGMASYVTLGIYESYNFTHNGERYEINLMFFNHEQNNKFNMDDKCNELIFILENYDFNKDDSYQILEKCLSQKIGEEIPISNTRKLELSFFDYKNEKYTFQFNEYSDNIQLVSTSSNFYYPTHNITVSFFSNENLENQMDYAINFVFEN